MQFQRPMVPQLRSSLSAARYVSWQGAWVRGKRSLTVATEHRKGKDQPLNSPFKTINLVSWLPSPRLYLLQHHGPLGNIQDPSVNRTLSLLLFLKNHLLGSLLKALCVCLLFYLFCSHIYNTFYLTLNCWFLFLILFIDLDVWLVDV